MKLSAEQQELLSSITDERAACQALYLAATQCVAAMQSDMHTLALTSDNEKELIYRKCRADGAVRLLGELKNLLRL